MNSNNTEQTDPNPLVETSNTMDPQLVHRILLHGPHHFDRLVVSRAPSIKFEEFRQRLLLERGDPSFIMKRAFYDNLVEKTVGGTKLEPLLAVLRDLNQSIRSLVPNRPDLHTILNDERDAVNATTSTFCEWIVEAARALEQLESASRSGDTREWLQTARVDLSTEFLVTSLLYLLDKVELCHGDKRDFYLSHVVAPQLYNSGEGLELERRAFQGRFGKELPLTRQWIREQLTGSASNNKTNLLINKKDRRNLVVEGWINTILFRVEGKVELPEIFVWDLESLRSIRRTTQKAAAGCALSLLASQASGISPSVMDSLGNESAGRSLVEAMANQRHSSVEAYEQSVADVVVSLARTWIEDGQQLDVSALDSIRGQTQAVLRGQDPVLKLLDNRMRSAFSSLSSQDLDMVPVAMRSGVQSQPRSKESSSTFIHHAQKTFESIGMSLFASDLAEAAELATKVGVLAMTLYGKSFLDQMILDEI